MTLGRRSRRWLVGLCLIFGGAVLPLASVGPAAAHVDCSTIVVINGTNADNPNLRGDAGGSAGHDHHDHIDGLGGNDDIEGYSCHDHLWGGSGYDEIHGGFGDDIIDGEADSDGGNVYPGGLYGGGDDDFIDGGNGDDFLTDTEAGGDADFLYGQAGGDDITVVDGDLLDAANGGTGTPDVCRIDTNQQGGADGGGLAYGCEQTYIYPI